MADPRDDDSRDASLNERILDVLIFIPAGIAVSVVEELPKLATRGRDRIGVRVSSARAVGKYAMKAGRNELLRRSDSLLHLAGDRPPAKKQSDTARAEDPGSTAVATEPHRPSPIRPSRGNGHVPAVSTLSIPGFDTLSASQVVQRLDGLNRVELVSVRAYEASTRGRRTILNRVDQLLDERS
jgi:hypothetical protein